MGKPRAEIPTHGFWRNTQNYAIALGLIVAWITGAGGTSWAAASTKPERKPDFGPNVLIFDPTMPQVAMQEKIDMIYALERSSEFGSGRYALLFLPGEYHLNVPVGFYTQVLGLGASPDAVHISGNVHADASHDNNNCDYYILAWCGGFFRDARRGYDAVGSFSGGGLPTYARSR